MGTIVTPSELKPIIHGYLGCPICGSSFFANKRSKPEKHKGDPIVSNRTRIYRCSVTSITIECRSCGIRYNVTWNHFRNALKKISRGERFLTSWSEAIGHFVDADHSLRKPPRSR